MEFPWSAVGVLFSLITLVVLLGYNIPKFIKYVYAPKITVLLYIYSKNQIIQEGVIQRVEDQTFEKEIQVLPNTCPQVTVLIKPRWKYEVKIIEVVGYAQSKITRLDHFAKKRFWLENEYTDVHGDYKVFPNLTIRKDPIIDPLVLDLKIEPAFNQGEERRIVVRISVNESRKLLQKEFLIKATIQPSP
jgi:hypothetical protein